MGDALQRRHGRNWARISNFQQQLRALVGIEVHPRDPDTIWVSHVTWDFSSKGEIYKTTDGGKASTVGLYKLKQ